MFKARQGTELSLIENIKIYIFFKGIQLWY